MRVSSSDRLRSYVRLTTGMPKLSRKQYVIIQVQLALQLLNCAISNTTWLTNRKQDFKTWLTFQAVSFTLYSCDVNCEQS